MATAKQIAAARANGAKSRGPVTVQGKRNSSRNNLRHGAFAFTLYLEGEWQQRFQDSLAALTNDWQPDTPVERLLILRAAIAITGTHQMGAAQTRLWTREFSKQQALAPSLSHRELRVVTFRALNDRFRASAVLSQIESRHFRDFENAVTRLDAIKREKKRRKTDFEPTKS